MRAERPQAAGFAALSARDPCWGAQSVTVSYERARGLRAVGERPEGFSIKSQLEEGEIDP